MKMTTILVIEILLTYIYVDTKCLWIIWMHLIRIDLKCFWIKFPPAVVLAIHFPETSVFWQLKIESNNYTDAWAVSVEKSIQWNRNTWVNSVGTSDPCSSSRISLIFPTTQCREKSIKVGH